MRFNNTKIIYSALFLVSILLSACGGGGSSTSNNTPATTGTLTSIAVTPSTATIAIGQATNFTVIGTYSDGTTRNITSTVNCGGGSAISTLRCNPIVATGTAVGSATIDAWVDISGTAVTVTSAAELAAYCSARTVLCSSATLTVTSAAGTVNAAPIANAGIAQNVITGTLVTLNGSASSDANNDPLTYAWTLTSKPTGSTASLTGATSAAPTFTADLAGTYVASLTVNDGQVNSASASVTITATVGNAAPVANAGAAQNVTTGTLVTLNGSASSDANGDPLTYNWTLTSKPVGSTAVLASATSSAPTFTADAAGTYVASLTVNDGQVNSASASVTITATVANAAPVANAGTAQNVTTGTLVTLNGSASSDANNDPLTYAWTLTSKPTGSTASLTGATSAAPTFTADAAGTYVASLTVNDSQANSISAMVTITAATTAGTLDITFNSSGKVTTAFGTGSAVASGAAFQSDGKIVVAGTVTNGTTSSFALARYNTDGSLDTTFNGTGTVTTPIGVGSTYGNAVAIQSDGKILVVGGAQTTVSSVLFYGFALARYNADGSLDATFNSTGTLVSALNVARSDANAIAIQPDGKIVVGGSSSDGTSNGSKCMMARYNSNGSLDTTFNLVGKVADFPNSLVNSGVVSTVNAVNIQADGKIVAAGSWEYGFRLFYLARINSDGSADSTLGSSGSVTTYFSGTVVAAHAIAAQTDGRILMAGESGAGFTFTRNNPNNGSADTTFGANHDGESTSIIGTGNDVAKAVALQADGKIVAVGTTYNGLNSDFALLRLAADGATYDIKVITSIGTANASTANAVVIQSDGKIVAVGGTGGTASSFALVRYLP